jgi:hypothetical protein
MNISLKSLSLVDLAPSLGFFGSDAHTCLTIDVNAHIISLRLQLQTEKPEILNLRAIEFYGADKQRIELTPANVELQQSSTFTADYDAPGLLLGTGIHTHREPNPWWELKFAEPEFVKTIKIFNRPDTWGSRSLSLSVSARSSSGKLELYAPSSATETGKLLSILIESLLFKERYQVGGSTHDQSIARQATDSLKNAIALADMTTLQQVPIPALRYLIQFADIYRERTPSELDLRYLASVLFRIFDIDDFIPISSLTAYSTFLAHPNSIVKVEEFINDLFSSAGSSKRVVFTKHGINQAKLLSDKDGFLRLSTDVISLLNANDIQCFLAYGTLLGTVRDESFMPHDDDVDLLCYADASSEQEAFVWMMAVADLLRSKGFIVRQAAPYKNFHISRGSYGVDLFPSWLEGNQFHLYMEKMKIRSIPADIIFPLGHATLHGVRYPAPNDKERFLAERYGPVWRVPDRFHEWPWPVESA